MYSLEANFLVFRKSLILDLIMKSWVTCALDENCIAPKGSHIYGRIKNWKLTGVDCFECDCHRLLFLRRKSDLKSMIMKLFSFNKV